MADSPGASVVDFSQHDPPDLLDLESDDESDDDCWDRVTLGNEQPDTPLPRRRRSNSLSALFGMLTGGAPMGAAARAPAHVPVRRNSWQRSLLDDDLHEDSPKLWRHGTVLEGAVRASFACLRRSSALHSWTVAAAAAAAVSAGPPHRSTALPL